MAPILQINNLKTHFFTKAGILRAVDGVSLEIGAGEIVGLVGESGSGKSITGFSIIGLVDAPGRIVSGETVQGAKPHKFITAGHATIPWQSCCHDFSRPDDDAQSSAAR